MYRFFSALGSDALVEILSQSSGATAVYTGPELKIQLVNDAMLAIWGKDPSIHGKTFEEALPEMEGQPFTGLLKNVWATGKTYEAHDTPATLEINGEMVTSYFDFIYKPILNKEGEVYCILHTATDVTERVKARELVREKEEREQQINKQLAAANQEYRTVNEKLNKANEQLIQALHKLAFTEDRMYGFIETAPAGLAVLQGTEMLIETANPEMLKIYGNGGDNLIGKPLRKAFPVLDGQVFSDQLSHMHTSGERVSLHEIEFTTYISGNKEIKYLDIHFQPLLSPDHQTGPVMATVTDVSEKVAAKKLLENKELLLQEFNEELTVLNEELQMTNEELGTLNEEYSTINEQLEQANRKISLLNDRLKKENNSLAYDGKEFRDSITRLDGSNKVLEYRNKELRALNDTITQLNGKLSETQASFTNLIAQAPVAMMLVKGDNFIVSMINRQMLELIGKDASIIGKPLFEELPELKGQKAADLLMKTFTEGKSISDYSNPVMLNRNGNLEEGFFNFSYTPYVENGKVTGVIDMAVEVTPQMLAIQDRDRTIVEKTELEEILRNSEQRLHSILETMAEGVGVTDADGRMIYANPMAQQILGLSESKIKERTYDAPEWQNLRLDGTPLPSEEHPMSVMMRTGKPVYDYEIAVQPPDRECFYISINAAPIFDHEGRLTGGIGTFMDVTSRRLIMQGKDDFISIASHELKTPVTALKASLQLLQRSHEKLPSESRTRLLEQSVKSLDKLSCLITDLLDTGRIEQGQLKVEKKEIILSELFNDCCSDLIRQTDQEIVFTGDTSLFIEADSQQVGQVIVNFINNALKYAPDSETITVNASRLNDYEIKISVIDHGPGIPPEKIKHLFKRYYRTDYQDRKFTGLGLGLYISAEIIKNHGGKIGVESEMGKGSEFWFTLPVINKENL